MKIVKNKNSKMAHETNYGELVMCEERYYLVANSLVDDNDIMLVDIEDGSIIYVATGKSVDVVNAEVVIND